MPQKILFKRGLFNNLPALDIGEPAITTDTQDLYFGSSQGNIRIPSKKDVDGFGISVKNFGVKGDGVTDDTVNLTNAINFAINNLPCKLYFPKGTYLYTQLPNIAYSGLTLDGLNDRSTILKCISNVNYHTALLIDAFTSGNSNAPFIQRCNLKNLTIEGNANTLNIVCAQGIARCNWENIIARNGNTSTNAIAFNFKGVMLNNFKNLICSTDLDTNMISVPYMGLMLTSGSRAGVNIGNSSNNVFENTYMEGLQIGIKLDAADQNTFIGGSAESNAIYGLIIGSSSRYNTFIGSGFENPNSTGDITDIGISTQYLNIYSTKKTILQGRGSKISGGYFEGIEIQAGAIKNVIDNVTIKYFTGTGSYSDSGTGTSFKNIYDYAQSKYIYPLKDRQGISVGASPFTYQNTQGRYIEVIIQSGTISQIMQYRGTDSWLCNTAAPNKILLAPNDSLQLTYSVTPSMSYVNVEI